MEFERAIYRVYEKSIESIRDETTGRGSRSCRLCAYIILWMLLFFTTTLITLHVTFVGNPGCLPDLLKPFNSTGPFVMRDDYILQININKAFEENEIGLTDDSQQGSSTSKEAPYRHGRRSLLSFGTLRGDSGLHNANTTNTTAEVSYEYEFAYDSAVLGLSTKKREDHGFRLINVTMMSEECFGSSPLIGGLIPFGGVDVVVENAVKYTMKHSGVLTTSTDYFAWSTADAASVKNVGTILSRKLNMLLVSLLAFFAISSLTAMLVRVLISSGVVILFPLFWGLELLGFNGLLNTRIIAMSYPWLGIPMEILETSRQSSTPFVLAHLTRIIVFYLLYQSGMVYFTMLLYDRMFPGPGELWLFSMVMVWEYYSMLFVRSLSSIRVFPRLCLSGFLLFHFYKYSYPSGFHSLALLVLFLFICWTMNHCAQKYELPAYLRGDVNYDRPRALHNHLPWPAWNAALPPDFSVFQPLSQRSTGVYQAEVPPLHAEVPAQPQPPLGNDTPTFSLLERLRGLLGFRETGYRPVDGTAVPEGEAEGNIAVIVDANSGEIETPPNTNNVDRTAQEV